MTATSPPASRRAGRAAPESAQQAATGQRSLNVAIKSLQQAVTELAAIVSSRAGAAQIQGGGAAAPKQTGPWSFAPAAALTSSPGDLPASPPRPTAPGDEPAADGDVRQRIVEAARGELKKDIHEQGGEDRGDDVKRYRSAVTGPGEDPNAAEPWCADFASWVWKQAGVPFGKDGKGDDFTVSMIKRAQGTGSWKTDDPKPGDLVLIDWDGGRGASDPSKLADHVAVVEKVENGKVFTIGGNESDSVKASSYPLDDKRMLGFIKPQSA